MEEIANSVGVNIGRNTHADILLYIRPQRMISREMRKHLRLSQGESGSHAGVLTGRGAKCERGHPYIAHIRLQSLDCEAPLVLHKLTRRTSCFGFQADGCRWRLVAAGGTPRHLDRLALHPDADRLGETNFVMVADVVVGRHRSMPTSDLL